MYLVIHYSEIGTKGKNRIFFEQILTNNIKKSLGEEAIKVYRKYGRIICELKDIIKEKKIKSKLQSIPGIYNFMFAKHSSLNLEEIKKSSIDILKNLNFNTFKVKTSRSNKKFEKTSQEINEIIGEHILNTLNKKVDLKNPDITLYIEICEKEAFLGYKKYKGIGGLPIGSSGKLISSLSGGIDSPVASFLMMKRGCEIIFVHIYNSTQLSNLTYEKIENLVKQLTKFQLSSKIYIIPFEKIQKQIIMNVPSKYRMIIYRRFMMKILNGIAKKEKAKGIITGDNIGQVASQTIENLNCIYEASELPVFSPLIGLNKEEIIQLAKKIKTYNFSIQPYPDCCSFMISKHPETKGKITEIKRIENKIKEKNKLINNCIKSATIKIFNNN